MITLPFEIPVPTDWQPWHAALAVAAVLLLCYIFARVRLAQATNDWADAFFYSPSQRVRRRQRKQRWQDWSWAILLVALAAIGAAGTLYFTRPK